MSRYLHGLVASALRSYSNVRGSSRHCTCSTGVRTYWGSKRLRIPRGQRRPCPSGSFSRAYSRQPGRGNALCRCSGTGGYGHLWSVSLKLSCRRYIRRHTRRSSLSSPTATSVSITTVLVSIRPRRPLHSSSRYLRPLYLRIKSHPNMNSDNARSGVR